MIGYTSIPSQAWSLSYSLSVITFYTGTGLRIYRKLSEVNLGILGLNLVDLI